MARNTDFTGEAAKKSIAETMEKIMAYHAKYWKEGNELKVQDYVEKLFYQEIEKFLSDSKRDQLIGPLSSYVHDTANSRYVKIFERYLLEYGPYIMTLVLEYVSAREWMNRYSVSPERRAQLIDEAYEQAIKDLKKIGLW